MYLYLLWIPISCWLFLGSSLYNLKNMTIHLQISQHTVCPQPPTPPLAHIYSSKSMCMCVYSAYFIMCVYACVFGYVYVASQSPLFHNIFVSVFFLSLLASITWCGIEFHDVMALCSTNVVLCASHSLFWTWGLWRDLLWHVWWGMHGCPSSAPVVQTDSSVHSTCQYLS